MKEIKKQADYLLEEIAEWQSRLAEVEKEIAIKIEEIAGKYQDDIDRLKSLIKTRDSQLRRLIKKHKKGLFIDTAQASIPGPVKEIESVRIDLEHGALLYSVKKWVKRAKGMLDRLKKEKEKKAIKTTETVNWDELEKWPDDKLKKFGTERKDKELFEYEVNSPK
ncbi:MAG: host-nuclease inhibitor Gam family protein [Thermodesulfobacteriota bacterium]|nr:host-nuclease inhibitor Gam family protein [Thermodesulfobacteriota bacterium]